MKKVLNFSKGFIPCAIFSLVLIILGIVGFVTKGINLGLDFKPGLIQEVRIAKPAILLTYNGSAKATVELTNDGVNVIVSGTGAENKTSTISYANCATVQDVAAALNSVEGVDALVQGDEQVESFYMFLNSAVGTQLSDKPTYIYAKNTDATTEDVRESLQDVKGISIKSLGSGDITSFQIRMAANSEDDSSAALQNIVNEKLVAKFGDNNVAVIKTDFVASGYSQSLATKSIVLLIATMVLIWAYAAIRFHWDFALGSVVALIHDVLIVFSFICWSQVEFSTTVLAAVLTLIGYSINATVVILDRIRFNLSYEKANNFNEVLNSALSKTLTRSILTTVTTLFAVISLYIFTTGSIKDFALVLMVGLVSGCYSSIFISSGFISFMRRNWKPEYGIHHSEKSMKKGVLDMNSGVTV